MAHVPYDSGLAFVREPQHLRSAMTVSAGYLQASDIREPYHYTPEASRRARAIEVWAAFAVARPAPTRGGLVAWRNEKAFVSPAFRED